METKNPPGPQKCTLEKPISLKINSERKRNTAKINGLFNSLAFYYIPHSINNQEKHIKNINHYKTAIKWQNC